MSLTESNSRAAKAAEFVRQAIRKLLDPTGSGVLGVDTISNAAAAFVFFIAQLPVLFFSAVFAIAAEITSAFLDGISEVRDNNRDEINDVIASALTEVLGVEVSSADLPKGESGATNLQLYRAVGRKVLATLTTELGGNPSDSPGPGELGAAGFMGFGLNFAVNSGILGLIGEIASLGFIKGFDEMAEELQHTLGFGRLMRLAIQPLMHALVSVPYTREANAQYRPHQLAVGEYLTAMQAGRLDPEEVKVQLAQLGFKDEYITELITQHRRKLQPHQVEAMVRWGRISREDGVKLLVEHGMDSDLAGMELDALDFAAADRQEHAYAAEILKLAQQRFIDSETYSTLIQRLHFSPLEQQGWLNRLGVYLDSETKRLTLSELLYLAEHNLVTLDQIDAWATAEGYNADAAAMLDLWITQKELDWQAVQAAKAARKKKPPAQPPPTT